MEKTQNPTEAEAPEAAHEAESLVVECATCSVQFPWKELAEGPPYFLATQLLLARVYLMATSGVSNLVYYVVFGVHHYMTIYVLY